MANKYCNLDGSKKIKDEYQKINIGFDKVEEDVNKINDDINALDERVDEIITTPVEDVSAEEIIDARGGRPVLGKRFEDIEVELAAHKAASPTREEVDTIALLKADKTYVDDWLSKIGSAKPSGAFPSLTELQTTYPNGDGVNYYVVTEDNHWYYWNGSVWTKGGLFNATVSDDFPATNRVVNGDFSDDKTKWTTNYGTSSVSNNVITLTGNGTNNRPHIIQNVGARINGHKYYSKAMVRCLTEGVTRLDLYNGSFKTVSNPVVGEWYDLNLIRTDNNSYNYLAIYFQTDDAASSLDQSIEIKYVLEIDLTATFGVGNEPSLEEMNEIMSKFPNSWFDGTISPLFDNKEIYLDVKALKDKKIDTEDLLDKSITNSKLADYSVTPEKTTFMTKSRNLFDGIYYPYSVGGTPGVSAILRNTIPDSRTAIVPIESGKTYTVKIHEPSVSNRFRLATHTEIPTAFSSGVANLTTLIVYNDSLKEYTFTADLTGYVFITVSNDASEPLLQVEEGEEATNYVEHFILKESVVKESIENNDIVQYAKNESEKANSRLDNNLLFPKVANVNMIPTDPGARFIDYFDGKMWGYTGTTGDISYSTDEGTTWEFYTDSWNREWGWISRLLPTADGEVLALSGSNLRKSSGWGTGNVTWSENKVTKHENATFFQFGFDGDGTKFILAEYANGISNWKDSRNVWISTDMGETFNVVWDSLEKHGEEVNAITHLHGVAYDRWGDRFYFSEGHGPAGGLYVSLDDGETWHQPKGYRDGVLKSGGIEGHQTERDTNGPTVLVATPTGLVMGSDNSNNGMFGLVRKDNIEEEIITQTYSAKRYRPGLIMFAIRGFYDDDSGTAYITFRSEYNDVPPIICAGTPTEANMIYEYPNLPVVGASDHFGAVAKVSDDRLVCYAQFGTTPYTMQADLVYPVSEIQTIIRLELKKLGLIS